MAERTAYQLQPERPGQVAPCDTGLEEDLVEQFGRQVEDVHFFSCLSMLSIEQSQVRCVLLGLGDVKFELFRSCACVVA